MTGWHAVVQGYDDNGNEKPEEEELVFIEEKDGRPVIELSDGTRITCTMPAGERAA